MSYHIIAIGPKHEHDLLVAIKSYEKRLQHWGGVNWTLLPYGSQDQTMARRVESDAIRAKLRDDDYVILLDERGTQLTSPALAAQLDTQRSMSKRIIFVIGGAYGIDEILRGRANLVWSLSELVFPHQLVRLILVEQLYRAHTILDNHPYHH